MPKDVAFSHNDLLANNIFMLKDSKEPNNIKYIDFEYGSMNFKAYDFGNHFAEFTLDYDEPKSPWFKLNENAFPSDKRIIDCIKIYLVFSNHKDKIKDEENLLKTEGAVDTFIA